MTALRFAVKEYFQALTVSKSACLCWDGKKYVVNWYFSKQQCEKLNWEIIYG